MASIPAPYRIPGFPSTLKRDWEFVFLLIVCLAVGFTFLIQLINRDFTLLEDEPPNPERFARIIVGKNLPDVVPGDFKKPRKLKKSQMAEKRTVAKVKKVAESRDRVLKKSLVGVIATRSQRADTALGKILQKRGIGDEVDQVLKRVKKTGITGGGGEVHGTRGGKGEISGAEVGEIGGIGTGYGGGGESVSLGIKTSRKVTASLTRGRASIDGQLDPALIDKVVRQNLSGLKYCYEKELNQRPSLKGKIVVQFTIGLAGTVTDSIIESSAMGDAIVEDCILRRVRRWRFPKPEGGSVVVSYPFVFTQTS